MLSNVLEFSKFLRLGVLMNEVLIKKSVLPINQLFLLQTATSIATAMVKQFGMSPLVGMRVFDDSMEEVSNKTKNVIDKEINRSRSENHTLWLQRGIHRGN